MWKFIYLIVLLLAPAPVFADWPQFLGEGRDGKSAEQGLERDLLKVETLWTRARGESYSAPSILGDLLVHHTRVGTMERVECLDAATGKLVWQDETATTYKDRFNYLNGPRASASIDDGRVYTIGVQGVMSCHQLEDGKLLWRRRLVEEFAIGADFFGFTASPLIEGDSVIVNLGTKKCVAAFDKLTGKTKWVSGNEWGRSYASPVAATMHGKRVLLIFAGGESNPPVGGLLCVDPDSGLIHDRYPWRSPRYFSASASTPVVSGSRVFISTSYDIGGVMLEVQPDLRLKEVYRTKAYASHWTTPILVDGYLYGFANNKLVCMDWSTGERVWRIIPRLPGADAPLLAGTGRGADQYRPPPGESGFGIGSLIHADRHFLCLGENGLLAWMDLSPEGCKILSATRLFMAKQTWTAPVLSGGKTFICQNYPSPDSQPRLICLDMKAKPEPVD